METWSLAACRGVRVTGTIVAFFIFLLTSGDFCFVSDASFLFPALARATKTVLDDPRLAELRTPRSTLFGTALVPAGWALSASGDGASKSMTSGVTSKEEEDGSGTTSSGEAALSCSARSTV